MDSAAARPGANPGPAAHAADPEIVRSAAVHAALGDPVRLAIVHRLRTSDCTPGDLAAQLELTTPLIAHHLATLETAGVIERTASRGDRRRRYVRLHPTTLDAIVPIPAPVPDVVFVCTHNSARSQLATAMWTGRTGRRSRSAGTEPADRVHPGAVAAAQRVGLDIGTARPQLLTGVGDTELLVTVCDRANETLEHTSQRWHWSLPDPAERGTDDAFDDVVRQLEQRIATVTGPRGTP